jgi:hypothetical protein
MNERLAIIWGQVRERPMGAIAGIMIILSMLLSSYSSLLSAEAQNATENQAKSLAVVTEQDANRACDTANEARQNTRRIAAQVGIESAEAIIEIAGANVEPERIMLYREAVARRMEIIANQLPDRDCSAEARVRAEQLRSRQEATQGEE